MIALLTALPVLALAAQAPQEVDSIRALASNGPDSVLVERVRQRNDAARKALSQLRAAAGRGGDSGEVALIAAVVTWWFPHVENGFFKVAGWSAIALPSATVVMCVDQFVLPRLLGVHRPVAEIPSWRAAGIGNWPAIVSVLVAVLFGAWGLQLFPGQTSAPSLGLVPVEAWLVAGVLYLALAAAVGRTRQASTLLGFGRHLRLPVQRVPAGSPVPTPEGTS